MFITILLLIASNIFMTYAWYAHLKHPERPLILAIVLSWLVAFFEYALQVPANRIGFKNGFDITRLKIAQEAITLVVFVIFAKIVFAGEPMRWNYYVGFGLVFLAVFVVNYKW